VRSSGTGSTTKKAEQCSSSVGHGDGYDKASIEGTTTVQRTWVSLLPSSMLLCESSAPRHAPPPSIVLFQQGSPRQLREERGVSSQGLGKKECGKGGNIQRPGWRLHLPSKILSHVISHNTRAPRERGERSECWWKELNWQCHVLRCVGGCPAAKKIPATKSKHWKATRNETRERSRWYPNGNVMRKSYKSHCMKRPGIAKRISEAWTVGCNENACMYVKTKKYPRYIAIKNKWAVDLPTRSKVNEYRSTAVHGAWH